MEQARCANGCDRDAYRRGLCWRCYRETRGYVYKRPTRPCTAPGCTGTVHGHDLCLMHLQRLERYGSLDLPTPADRFRERVDLNGPNGCHIWIGNINQYGYGRFNPGDGSRIMAHVYAFELANGPIPVRTSGKLAGRRMAIDHLCRNRACVNPSHLEVVTDRVNTLRSMAPSAVAIRENRCKRGHEFTPENTYVQPGGGRSCKTCRREYQRELRRRNQ